MSILYENFLNEINSIDTRVLVEEKDKNSIINKLIDISDRVSISKLNEEEKTELLCHIVDRRNEIIPPKTVDEIASMMMKENLW